MLDFNKLSFTSDSFSFAGTVRAKLSYMYSTWSMVISPYTGDCYRTAFLRSCIEPRALKISGVRLGFGVWDKIYRLDEGPKGPMDDRNFIENPQTPRRTTALGPGPPLQF